MQGEGRGQGQARTPETSSTPHCIGLILSIKSLFVSGVFILSVQSSPLSAAALRAKLPFTGPGGPLDSHLVTVLRVKYRRPRSKKVS